MGTHPSLPALRNDYPWHRRFRAASALAILVAVPLLLAMRQSGNPPPAELSIAGANMGLGLPAATNPTNAISYTASTMNKWVKIRWTQRKDTSSPWHVTKRTYSTTYYITDVQSVCATDFFVAGVMDDGTKVVERWTFGLDRDPYAERRTELYKGPFDHIRSVAPDPLLRFVLLFTYENPRVYKIILPSGSPTMLYDVASVPALASRKSMVRVKHVTEGPKFLLTENKVNDDNIPWGGTAVLLNDSNDDGTFESAEAVDEATWNSRGYNSSSVWQVLWKLCP